MKLSNAALNEAKGDNCSIGRSVIKNAPAKRGLFF